MIGIIFELICFVMFASIVCCIIPEADKPYNPRERPPFNQKLWEPTQEVFEKHQLSARWIKPAKGNTSAGIEPANEPSVV